MTEQVDIRLLGPIEASVGCRVLALRGQKRLGLLAMLALRSGAVPVDTLAEEIWPGQAPEQAVRSIRTYLSQFRRDAGIDFISADHTGTAYQLEGDRTTVDATAFRDAVAQASRADVSPELVQTLARDALDLWRGPALIEVRDQRWAASELQALEEARRAAQHLLVGARLALGDHVALCGELEMLVTEHPFDEAFWRDLMLAQYRSGRQTDALRTYQRARSTLVEAISLEPGPELSQLEAAIFRHDPELAVDQGSGTGAATRVAPPQAPSSALKSDLTWTSERPYPLVGRAALTAELTRLVAEPQVAPTLAVIEGQLGQGKSRLLAELAESTPESHLVLYGRVTEARTGPYALWRRMTQTMLPHVAADTDPESLARLHRMAGAVTNEGRGGSARPHAAFADLLHHCADSRPVVLVLDDMHAADEPSLRLVRYLVEERTEPLLILAGTRPLGASTADSAFSRTLSGARSAGRLRRFQLEPLSRTAVAELADSAHIDPELVESLWESTGGNPLLVTETLLDQRRSGRSAIVASASVQERMRERLSSYSEAGRELATVAALLGSPFDALLAGEACELGPDEAGDAVNELVDDYLVSAVEGDPGLFEFNHPLLAEALRALVPPGTVPVRHRAIAQALEYRRERRVPVDIGVLGHHWASAGRAGDLDRAVECLRTAAIEARRRFGYEIASAHLGRAIELLDQRGGDPQTRAELLLELAATENAAGDVNAAKDACLRAADAARITDRADLLADAALQYGGDLPLAEDVVDDQVLILLGEADAWTLDPARRARILSRLAQVEYWMASRSSRVAWCEEAMSLARGLADPALRARVLIASFWALYSPPETGRLLQILSELDHAVRELGDLEVMLAAGKCRTHLLLDLGDYESAVELSHRHGRLADRLGYSEFRRLSLAFAATQAGIEGRYDDAFELARRAQELMTAHGQRFQARLAHEFQTVAWRWWTGNFGDSFRWWDRLAAAEPDRPMWRAMTMWIAAETDQADRAAADLELLDLGRYVDGEQRVDWIPVLALAANTIPILGDADTARLVYDALLPYSSRNAMTGQSTFWGAVTHHLGMLATVLGDEETARDHLDDAVLRHDKMGAVAMTRRSQDALDQLR